MHNVNKIVSHAVQSGLTPLTNVKNIIAIASGKGGVGKSTLTVNLALALRQQGARVGILDADIYGPSIPLMLGIGEKKPASEDGQSMQPLLAYDLQVMSIGFLIAANAPAIWRGPMVSKALQQMLHQTCWQMLDYLLIDLPPGTGDIQLTLAQKIPLAGVIIITTPQDLALLDARKALRMFQKVNVAPLGIVENMSHYICPQCGHVEAIFGEQGGATMAEEFSMPLLGKLSLDQRIREHVDAGKPSVIAAPNSEIAQAYNLIASEMVKRLSLRKQDYSAKFGQINIEPRKP